MMPRSNNNPPPLCPRSLGPLFSRQILFWLLSLKPNEFLTSSFPIFSLSPIAHDVHGHPHANVSPHTNTFDIRKVPFCIISCFPSSGKLSTRPPGKMSGGGGDWKISGGPVRPKVLGVIPCNFPKSPGVQVVGRQLHREIGKGGYVLNFPTLISFHKPIIADTATGTAYPPPSPTLAFYDLRPPYPRPLVPAPLTVLNLTDAPPRFRRYVGHNHILCLARVWHRLDGPSRPGPLTPVLELTDQFS